MADAQPHSTGAAFRACGNAAQRGRRLRIAAAATALVLAAAVSPLALRAQSTAPAGEWRAFGADPANTKYSPLDQITVENFTDLEIAWRWTSISTDVTRARPGINALQFKTIPLMVGGLVYVSTAVGQVAALDAGTGRLVWSYDPRTYERLDRPANVGWHHRGVSYWEDGESDDARIFIATHDLLLVALDARTGALYPDFGDGGTVDLSGSLGRAIDRSRLTHSQPPAIVGDTVVVGSIVQDTFLTRREADPGHVRGFDARTGDMKWIFHTIPQGDEFGADSWENESWRYSGQVPPPATVGYFTDPWAGPVPGPEGLPLVKPPYKRVTAIDLNTGDHAWMSPHGDGPRNHPALRHLNLPALGGHVGMHGGGPLVTKTLLMVNSGGRYAADAAEAARTITAYHKHNGEYLGSVALPAVPYGNPITYLHEGRQYIAVAVGGGGGAAPPELIALALPR